MRHLYSLLTILLAALPVQAADVFSPSSRPTQVSAQRIERLEKQVDELVKLSLDRFDGKQDAAVVVMSAKVGAGKGLPNPNASTPLADERVIGDFNGVEIYVVDGFSKRRPAAGSARGAQ